MVLAKLALAALKIEAPNAMHPRGGRGLVDVFTQDATLFALCSFDRRRLWPRQSRLEQLHLLVKRGLLARLNQITVMRAREYR